MRRLLVKLVAIETAMVGWLAYWLFLVYANNPGIADQLAGNLQRFPQLSFSTIDITILVIIAGLAIALAFKFQRGLRPGIRLERALQMLENLMKRNLVLEAQVAELKIEKTHVGPMPPPAQPSLALAEPRPGSWEKAFRTPLEAGPPVVRSSVMNDVQPSFEREPSVAPPRIDMKQQVPVQTASTGMSSRPPIIVTPKPDNRPGTSFSMGEDKPLERQAEASTPTPTFSSSWEDSPKYLGESKGILNPSPPPRKTPAVSESSSIRQPYIPSPAPKKVPSSIIFGPMSAIPSSQPRSSTKLTPTVQASPKNSLPGSASRPSQIISKQPALVPTSKASGTSESSTSSMIETSVKPVVLPPTPSNGPSPSKTSTIEEKAPDNAETIAGGSNADGDKADDKRDVKSGRPLKRKFSYEEE